MSSELEGCAGARNCLLLRGEGWRHVARGRVASLSVFRRSVAVNDALGLAPHSSACVLNGEGGDLKDGKKCVHAADWVEVGAKGMLARLASTGWKRSSKSLT